MSEELLEEIKTHLLRLNEELDDARERLARIEGELIWLRRFVLAILCGVVSIILKVFFG